MSAWFFSADGRARARAAVLLVDSGMSYAAVGSVMGVTNSTISGTVRRFRGARKTRLTLEEGNRIAQLLRRGETIDVVARATGRSRPTVVRIKQCLETR